MIAQSGNTGNVSGPHLHFQVVLTPQFQGELQPVNSLDSENRSRNPELWLSPLENRGTAIGKITDQYGNPIQNLVVCGLRKAGQVIPIRTYSFPWANPDDLLYENFATTDVSPGNWMLHANERSRGCAATPHDYELDTYTFTGGKVTYIGLYPSWLAVLRPSSRWDVQTYVATHNTPNMSATNVTYFDASKVARQWQSTAVSHSSTLIDSVYLPLWYDNYRAAGDDWASGVNVHNVGGDNNQVTITWYRLNGTTEVGWSQTCELDQRATCTFYNPSQLNNFIGSAWIQASQPIVAVSNIHNWAATGGDSALSFTGSNRPGN